MAVFYLILIYNEITFTSTTHAIHFQVQLIIITIHDQKGMHYNLQLIRDQLKEKLNTIYGRNKEMVVLEILLLLVFCSLESTTMQTF